jgi:multidrug resistance efflux pump
MSEMPLREGAIDSEAPVPYRAVEGLRNTARSRGRGPRNYVVRAPNGEMCELGEEEHFLLTMLDGKRTFGQIEQEFRAHFDGNLSPQHFQSFIAELRSTGIIESIDQRKPAAAPKEASPQAISIVDEMPIDEPPEADWGGEMVSTSETAPARKRLPVAYSRITFAPIFRLLAWLGAPLRYLAWLLVPAAAAAGIALYVASPHPAAAAGAGVAGAGKLVLYCLVAVLAALIVPNLVRAAVAAFHGAPNEAFRVRLAGYVVPWFTTDRAWLASLSRKAQDWSYAAPLLARLAIFTAGAALWLTAAERSSALALAELAFGIVGLWSFLLSASPLWRGDGRRWMASYFEDPALDRTPWPALRTDHAGAYVAAAFISLAGIFGAALLWGHLTWDLVALLLGAAEELTLPFLKAARDLVAAWFGGIGDAAPTWLGLAANAATAWVGSAGEATGSWLGAAWRSASERADAVLPLVRREIGAGLLGGAYGSGLLWLAWAHARVAASRLPVTSAWDAMPPRRVAANLPSGRTLPIERAGSDLVPASLDERLFAGGESWPSNTKVLILAALIAFVLSVAYLSYPYESGGSFTILPSDQYDIRARVAGEITEVLVSEGQQVKPGQLLAALSDWTETHNVAIAKAGLEKASAQLQNLLQLPKPEQVALARQQYEQAASRLPFSKADYERDLALVQTGAVSVRQFEQSQSSYEQDKAAAAVTKANYDLVRVGPTQAEIETARAAVRLATEQVAFAEDQLDRTRLRATASGTVVTPNPQLMKGKFLKEGDLFVQVQDHRVAHVEVQVPETDIREISIGSRVRAKAWGYEHTIWPGKVTLIAQDATSVQAIGNIVRVVAEIPNSEGLLRPRMSGYAKVQTAEMPVWESFTRAAARFLLIELWSWVP